jgi:hypothetical protein
MDWNRLEEHARAKIIEAGGLSLPGSEKLDVVLDQVCAKIDDLIEPKSPIAEALSDAGIRAARGLLRAWLQSRYEKARADGLVR